MANRPKGKAAAKDTGLLKALCFILVILFIAAIIGGGIGWAKAKNLEEKIAAMAPSTADTPGNNDGDNTGNEAFGGLNIKDGETQGVRMSLARIAAEDYEDYGIDTQAETAYTITATVFNEDGEAEEGIQEVIYSLDWAEEKNEPVSDYVSLEQDGMQAILTCLQEFDTEITLTCASTISPDVKGTKTLGYYKRLASIVCFPVNSISGSTVQFTVGNINRDDKGSLYAIANPGSTVSFRMPAYSSASSALSSHSIRFPANGTTFGIGTEIPEFTINSISIVMTNSIKSTLSRKYQQTYSVYPCDGTLNVVPGQTASLSSMFQMCGGGSNNPFMNSATVRADVYRALAEIESSGFPAFQVVLNCTYNGEDFYITRMFISLTGVVAPSATAVEMDGEDKLYF